MHSYASHSFKNNSLDLIATTNVKSFVSDEYLLISKLTIINFLSIHLTNQKIHYILTHCRKQGRLNRAQSIVEPAAYIYGLQWEGADFIIKFCKR